jgi:uncharacterized protein
MSAEFWREKSLTEMSRAEWESLCDGCGQCCRIKLEDEDSGWIAVTHAVCRLLDTDSCRCTRYPQRHELVPDCIEFDANLARGLRWLPDTCAYRLLAEGEELPWWHPLVSGSADTVHEAGISVRGRVVSEDLIPVEQLEDQVLHWIDPKAGRRSWKEEGQA